MKETQIGGTFFKDFEELTGVSIAGLNLVEKTDAKELGIGARLGEDIVKFVRIVDDITSKERYKSSIQINLGNITFDLYEIIYNYFMGIERENNYRRISVFKDIATVMIHTTSTWLGDSVILDIDGKVKSAYALDKGDRIIIGKHHLERYNHVTTDDRYTLAGKVATVSSTLHDGDGEFLVVRVSKDDVSKEEDYEEEYEGIVLFLPMDEMYITENK